MLPFTENHLRGSRRLPFRCVMHQIRASHDLLTTSHASNGAKHSVFLARIPKLRLLLRLARCAFSFATIMGRVAMSVKPPRVRSSSIAIPSLALQESRRASRAPHG